MPTVFRQDGLRVMIHPHDHRPPHVHCYKAGGVTIVNLGAAPGNEVIREAIGASQQEQRDALRIVCEHHGEMLTEWRRFHG